MVASETSKQPNFNVCDILLVLERLKKLNKNLTQIW